MCPLGCILPQKYQHIPTLQRKRAKESNRMQIQHLCSPFMEDLSFNTLGQPGWLQIIFNSCPTSEPHLQLPNWHTLQAGPEMIAAMIRMMTWSGNQNTAVWVVQTTARQKWWTLAKSGTSWNINFRCSVFFPVSFYFDLPSWHSNFDWLHLRFSGPIFST